MILEGHEISQPPTWRCDVLVVGSGSGGAVVAAVLAEAGHDVLVLEEGGYHVAKDFSQREDEMYPLLYRAGGQQLSEDGLVNVLQGSCFGGSTVINTADCTPIPPEVLAHWQRRPGLAAVDAAAVEAARQRVYARLGVQPIPRPTINRNNALVLEGAAKLGLSGGTFDNNRQGCVKSGYCLIGCAYDAKKGANLTYLPAALAAGAAIHTDCRAERIERIADDRLRVHGSVVERGVRRARLPFVVETRRLVLAAGAVHSPALLMRSGLDRDLPQVGRNLTLQPQLGVTAHFPGQSVELWRGIPQSAYVDSHDDNTPEHGLGGFRVEGINGGIANSAGLFTGFGHDHKQRMATLSERAMALLLVPDRPSGQLRMEWRDGLGFAPRIDYRVSDEWQTRLRRGMKVAAEIYFAAGAQEVGFTDDTLPGFASPAALDGLQDYRVRSGSTHLVSAHVQGTCRMGRDPRDGVVDTDHRVFGQPNLYVVDASVMPSSAATHTMIPVMTLAERAAERMRDAWV